MLPPCLCRVLVTPCSAEGCFKLFLNIFLWIYSSLPCCLQGFPLPLWLSLLFSLNFLPPEITFWLVPTSDFSLGSEVWEWVLCHCCSHLCVSHRWLHSFCSWKIKPMPSIENLQLLNAAAQLDRAHISAFLQLNWCFKIDRWHKNVWKRLAVVLVSGLLLRWEHSHA